MTLATAAVLLQGPEFALIALLTGGSMALAWKLLGPLAQAFARRIEGRGAGAGSELDELRSRVQELEQQVGRVYELEERLDFAERLLAQHRSEAGRIALRGEAE